MSSSPENRFLVWVAPNGMPDMTALFENEDVKEVTDPATEWSHGGHRQWTVVREGSIVHSVIGSHAEVVQNVRDARILVGRLQLAHEVLAS